MRDDGGGGGAKILIDPDSLRTAASRVKATAGELSALSSALAGIGYPTMPPGILATVENAVAESQMATQSLPSPLADMVVELTRRAFWAEYANQLSHGYTLSGPAKQEFLNYLNDGTLLKYASPDDAMAAGKELAILGKDFRKDPKQLITIAAGLHGAESVADQKTLQAFSAGFVNEFGAKNMELVPRVIQAMESSRQITFGNPTDMRMLRDVARTWEEDGNKLQQDPVKDLLAPFSIALANATMSGRLTRTIEDEIADNDDTYATGALLSQGGTFSVEFLQHAFKKDVVESIVNDSPYHVIGSMEQPPGPAEYGIGWSSGHQLPMDTKQIVLAAIANNPKAAAAILAHPLDESVSVADRYGQRETVTDPVTLLYQYGHFDDHGTAFGHVFSAGEANAYADPAQRDQAGKLTLSMVDQLINHTPAGSMSAVNEAVARTLGDHYMGDLHQSADGANSSLSYDPDHDGVPGQANAYGIELSPPQLAHLMSTLLSDDSSRQPFLHGVSAYQANLIRDSVHSGAQGGVWAHQIGSFDGLVNSANEGNNIGDVQAAQAREQAISSALDDVVSLVPLPPGFDVVAGHVPDLIASNWGPHGPSATDQNVVFHDLLQNQMNTSLTAGYIAGHPDVAAQIPAQVAAMPHQGGFTPTSFVDDHDRVIPWGQMSDNQQRTFNAWYTHDQQIQHLAGPARTQAFEGFGAHDADQSGN